MITNPLLKNNDTIVTNPNAYVSNVIGAVISIFFIVGIIYFTWNVVFAGYHMINSQGESKKVEEARSHLTNAVIGIFVVFSIFALLKLVITILGLNIDTNNLLISLPSL
ncbi:MAG: hypothetical protein Q8P53_02895 [Candidatus Shapirobacteria bacterium]|nr:hypothetical protein [Candidatus Shapirobacteria bacterium]